MQSMYRRRILFTLALIGPLLAACMPASMAERDTTVRMVETARGPLEVLEDGAAGGRCVLMVPSLGRGATDFDDLARRLADQGYRVLRPQPRGIGRSAPYAKDVTLVQLADDVLDVIAAEASAPCVLLGHAFGNRVVRMASARKPEAVKALILLAAGGKTKMPPDIEAALLQSFDLALPEETRMKAVSKAFFAPGNDPMVWRDGWYRDVAAAQIEATERTKVEAWWSAGSAPILVLQPTQDILAPAENAEQLRKQEGDRVTVVYVDRAGHALLPEQPEAIARHVSEYLARL